MASLRELRRKVKSVRSTQQITRAMKMMAAAGLRRAQARILSARPFALKMQGLVSDIRADLEAEGVPARPPLLEKRAAGVRGVLLIASDRGLCGSFNTNLIHETLKALEECGGEKAALFCVGRKGRDFFRRHTDVPMKEYVNIFSRLSFAHAEMVSRDLMDFFLEQGGRDVTLIYNEFKSVLQQKLVRVTLLPLTPPPASGLARLVGDGAADGGQAGGGVTPPAPEVSGRPADVDFIYEPRREQLLNALLPRHLKAQVFRALLETHAAVLSARMVAMENATKNALEMIEQLTLTTNKVRQAAITKEIAELVGGAEALN